MAVHFSSESVEWPTPADVLERVTRCLGEIDLDPCADAEHTVPAHEHFTVDDDGLAYDWHGSIFMNPPYGRGVIDQWIEKLITEYEAGRVTQAIALVPARPGSAWFHRMREYPVAFWLGRVKFGHADTGAPFPSALFAIGVPIARFVSAFDAVADVFRLVTSIPEQEEEHRETVDDSQ
jgi:phage N-6-adenine-methyltransferase